MSEQISIKDVSEVVEPTDYEGSLSPVQKEQIKDTAATTEFELPSGRKLEFKKPSGVASFLVAKMLGQDSMNPMLSLYYTMAISIASLDGKVVKTPTSQLGVEALVERLGDDFSDAMFKFQDWANLQEAQNGAKK